MLIGWDKHLFDSCISIWGYRNALLLYYKLWLDTEGRGSSKGLVVRQVWIGYLWKIPLLRGHNAVIFVSQREKIAHCIMRFSRAKREST